MIFGIFAYFGEDMFLGEEMEIYLKIWDMEHVWTGTPPPSTILFRFSKYGHDEHL